MVFELFSGNSGHDRFPIVRRGYDPAVVDAFLDSLAQWDPRSPGEHSPSPAEVMDKMFPVVKRGYDRARVHRHLFSIAGGEMEQIAA